MATEHYFTSPLSHFDSADLLDALSTGIVVLDSHLCLIYANVGAQDLMAVSVNQARGRPLGELFHDSQRLTDVLRRSLDRVEPCVEHELTLRPIGVPGVREPHVIDLTVTPLEGQITGTHLLLELADATQRLRISRDNDLLSGMDGSRLMVRQLAHEIKNPLGGLRGAAQLLDRELSNAGVPRIHRGDHRRSRPAHRPGGFDDRAEPPAAEIAGQHPRALRARDAPAPRRSACRRRAGARLRPEPPVGNVRPQSAHPGAAERRAQCDAGRRANAGASWCGRACAPASTSDRHAIVSSPTYRWKTMVRACRPSC